MFPVSQAEPQLITTSPQHVQFEYKNIYSIKVPGNCVTVSESNTLINGICNGTKFAFVNSLMIYNQDPSKCIFASTNGEAMNLVECDKGSKFTFSESNISLLDNVNFVMTSEPTLGDKVFMQSKLTNNTSQTQFSQTYSDVEIPFRNIYNIKRPGMCLVVVNQIIQHGHCNPSFQFALVNEKLVVKSEKEECVFIDTVSKDQRLVECEQGSLFTYNEDFTFRLKSDPNFILEIAEVEQDESVSNDTVGPNTLSKVNGNSEMIKQSDVGLLMNITEMNPLVFEQGATSPPEQSKDKHIKYSAFSFSLNDVDLDFYNLYVIEKPGMCAVVSNTTLLFDECSTKSKFTFINDKLHYSEDRNLCVTGKKDGTPMMLVNCEEAEKFVPQSDGSIRLLSSTDYCIDANGEIGKPFTLVEEHGAPNSNRQFSFLLDKVKLEFKNIQEQNNSQLCIVVKEESLVFGNCDDKSQFSFFQGKLIYSQDRSKCITGNPWQQLQLLLCDEASLFTYGQYGDDTFRLKDFDDYSVDSSGRNGGKVFLSWEGKKKSLKSSQQFIMT
jgi:hypothetical protein